MWRRFLSDERGVSAIEYGLIGGLLTTIFIGVLGQAGDALDQMVDDIATTIEEGQPSND